MSNYNTHGFLYPTSYFRLIDVSDFSMTNTNISQVALPGEISAKISTLHVSEPNYSVSVSVLGPNYHEIWTLKRNLSELFQDYDVSIMKMKSGPVSLKGKRKTLFNNKIYAYALFNQARNLEKVFDFSKVSKLRNSSVLEDWFHKNKLRGYWRKEKREKYGRLKIGVALGGTCHIYSIETHK